MNFTNGCIRDLRLVLLLATFLTPVLHAQQSAIYVVVSDATTTQDADRLVSTLSQAGYTCTRVADNHVFGLYHVRVGPYSTQAQADTVRASFVTAGYHVPGSASRPIAAQQSTLEAEALTHLGGNQTSGPPATGSDLEAQALQSMKSNEIEAERQQQLAQQRAQQQRERAAEETASEADSAPTEPSSSGGGGFLNTLNNVLGAVNDQLATENADQAQRNAEQQQQADDLVARNNARRAQEAEQRRQQSSSTGNTSGSTSSEGDSCQGHHPVFHGCRGAISDATAKANYCNCP
jgi:hypothetical protein